MFLLCDLNFRRLLPGLGCCALGAALLAGCQTRPQVRPLSSELPPPPPYVAPPDVCRAAAAAFALNRQVSGPLLEELRIRAGARGVQALLPTDETPPANPQRLLVDVQPNGRIVGLRCG